MPDCDCCSWLTNCGFRNVGAHKTPGFECRNFRQHEVSGMAGTIRALDERLRDRAAVAAYEEREREREYPYWMYGRPGI